MKNILHIFSLFLVALILCSCKESNNKVIENNSYEYYKTRQYDKALPLLEKAAREGDAEAPFYLGVMYDEGKGVDKDMKRAFQYYKLAANQGSKEAVKKIAELEKEKTSQ